MNNLPNVIIQSLLSRLKVKNHRIKSMLCGCLNIESHMCAVFGQTVGYRVATLGNAVSCKQPANMTCVEDLSFAGSVFAINQCLLMSLDLTKSGSQHTQSTSMFSAYLTQSSCSKYLPSILLSSVSCHEIFFRLLT